MGDHGAGTVYLADKAQETLASAALHSPELGHFRWDSGTCRRSFEQEWLHRHVG